MGRYTVRRVLVTKAKRRTPPRAKARTKARRTARRNPWGKPKGFRTEASGTIWSKTYRTSVAARKALEKFEAEGYRGAVNNLNGKIKVRLGVDSYMDHTDQENPRGRRRNSTGAGGWPLVPSKRFPGESTLSCPKCGSTNYIMGTHHGPGGRLGDPGATEYLRCKSCGHETTYKSKRNGIGSMFKVTRKRKRTVAKRTGRALAKYTRAKANGKRKRNTTATGQKLFRVMVINKARSTGYSLLIKAKTVTEAKRAAAKHAGLSSVPKGTMARDVTGKARP